MEAENPIKIKNTVSVEAMEKSFPKPIVTAVSIRSRRDRERKRGEEVGATRAGTKPKSELELKHTLEAMIAGFASLHGSI